MDKQKDILLLFLLKNFCQNNGIEDKYSPIKKIRRRTPNRERFRRKIFSFK